MSPPMNPIDLVRAYQQGDTSALNGLVDLYHVRLMTRLYACCGRVEIAEDAAQDTWTKLITKLLEPTKAGRLPEFANAGAFFGWISRIGYNCFVDQIRQRGRESNEDEDHDVLTQEADEGPEPVESLIREEDAERIRAIVQGMKPHLRVVAVLKWFEGMEVAEIAEVLGIPQGTVYRRLHQAREHVLEFQRR